MLKVFKTRYILLAFIIIFQCLKALIDDRFLSTSIISRTFTIIECYAILMILPLMYDILYSMMSYKKPRRKLLLNYVPAIVIGTLIFVSYLAIDFNYNSVIHQVNLIIINSILCLQVLCFAVVMLMKFYRYHKKIFTYYVDTNDTDYPHTRSVSICFTLIILIIYCEIIFRRRNSFDDVATFIIYICITVAFLLYIAYHLSKITGETTIKFLPTTDYSADEVVEMAKQANPDPDIALDKKTIEAKEKEEYKYYESKVIEDTINQWVSRSDKPYLRESITLSVVADDIGINSRTLSMYINSVTKQNFNNWINNMRINEAKRLIKDDINISMITVAVKCGFADTAMLSKNFKRFAGCTPTAYKQQLKEGRDEE